MGGSGGARCTLIWWSDVSAADLERQWWGVVKGGDGRIGSLFNLIHWTSTLSLRPYTYPHPHHLRCRLPLPLVIN